MLCPQCDKPNPPSARFCLKCGQRLALVCPECGTELPLDPDTRFCLACGTQLPGPPSAAAEVVPHTIPDRPPPNTARANEKTDTGLLSLSASLMGIVVMVLSVLSFSLLCSLSLEYPD